MLCSLISLMIISEFARDARMESVQSSAEATLVAGTSRKSFQMLDVRSPFLTQPTCLLSKV